MTVLCYHAVQPNWTAPMCMSPEAFTAHGNWLAKRPVVPLQDSVKLLDRKGRLPRGMLALTFDDGFSSLYEHALRVLTRHRLPATVFLVAQTLTESGQDVDWVDKPPAAKLTTLTIDQILEMRAAGVRFESHSYAHTDLTQLGFKECVRDLRDSRELLESLLGEHVRLLAYPRGRQTEGVRRAAEQAGYSHAFTLPEHREPDGPYCVPRVGIYHGNSVTHLRIKSTPAYLGLRTGAKSQLQRRVHRARGGEES